MESVQEFTDLLSVLIANRPNAIQGLWGSIDANLRYLLAEKVGFYLGRWSEEQVWYARNQRGSLLKQSLAKEIRQLEKAYLSRLAFEKAEVPHWGFVHLLGRRRYGPFSNVLLSEVQALKELLKDCVIVFDKRRLGTKRTHNLILLRLYIGAWMEHRGRRQKLTIEGLADLISLGKRVDDEAAEDGNIAQDLPKDLSRFENNANNAVFLNRARHHAHSITEPKTTS